MKAPFGWTIVRSGGYRPYHVYKRDCPPDAAHWCADLAKDTFPSRASAMAEAKRRNKEKGLTKSPETWKK